MAKTRETTTKRRFFTWAPIAAPLLVWLLSGVSPGQVTPDNAFDLAKFKDPPAEYRGHAMWGFNLSNVTESQIRTGIEGMAGNQFGGFLIEASGGSGRNLPPEYLTALARPLRPDGIEYMSEEYLSLYRLAMEEAKKRGLTTILYDDWQFPTGTVSGQINTKYPQYMAKRLDMVEKDVAGPAKVELAIPKGTYMGAVLMNRDTHERVDISDKRLGEGAVQADVPKGNWKAMAFYLNHDAVMKIYNPGLVDYLDEAAMDAFLSLTYQKLYDHAKDYFGNVLTMSFYDEPSLHWLNGRTWTPLYNQKFQKKYGRSPIAYYPALWYDIGPETAAARNALFGLRAQLYAETFVGKLTQWCDAHGIRSSGHLDQEEVPNPVPTNGDLMKVFEHQDIPGHDDVFWCGRSNRGYKIVTSAAFNYDKPTVMAETYAAYNPIDDAIAFRTAMDQFAMGVSFQSPAGQIARQLKDVRALNRYTGRLSYMLQHGRHVADVAVLYPIASLQGCYKFTPDPAPKDWTLADLTDLGYPKALLNDGGLGLLKRFGPSWYYAYVGGIVPPEIDYQDVGEALYRGLRVDYTYLHPEVLEGRCVVNRKTLVLNNKENREEYSVLIVPGGSTLSASAATKAAEFYRSGGTVVATRRLPYLSAEFGRDKEVQRAIGDMFGVQSNALAAGTVPIDRNRGYLVRTNKAGGKAFFLPKGEPQLLDTALKQALPVRDVDIEVPRWPLKEGREYNGALTYIHKVKNGRDIYFFANSSENQVDTKVVLRGKKDLQIWNPHTGDIQQAEVTRDTVGGSQVTRVHLVLPPVTSLFYVQK